MKAEQFSLSRNYLGKTQKELARVLCVSPKAIQSFEQGWRNIPVSAERQLLFLLALRSSPDSNTSSCWEIRSCPIEWRENCAAWEFKAWHFCWFLNGTFCNGEFQDNWTKKIELCRQCEVYLLMLPNL